MSSTSRSKNYVPHSTLLGSQIVSDLPSRLALMLRCPVQGIFKLKDWELLYDLSKLSSHAFISLSSVKDGWWRIQFLLSPHTSENPILHFHLTNLQARLTAMPKRCILNAPASGQVEVFVCLLGETFTLKTHTRFIISAPLDRKSEA